MVPLQRAAPLQRAPVQSARCRYSMLMQILKQRKMAKNSKQTSKKAKVLGTQIIYTSSL